MTHGIYIKEDKQWLTLETGVIVSYPDEVTAIAHLSNMQRETEKNDREEFDTVAGIQARTAVVLPFTTDLQVIDAAYAETREEFKPRAKISAGKPA